MNKYLQLATKDEVSYWISHNLKNYLDKPSTHENISEIEHIIDFLNSDKAPARLKKMSYEEALNRAEKWVKAMVKKGHNVVEEEGVDFEVVIDFKDGFKLIRLMSEKSFKKEGYLMSHCVADYFDKGSRIYSLRDSKGGAHCTLEIPEEGDSFYQCKGKGNGPIHHKYISYIIETMKHFNIDIRDSEMSNLGYFYPEGSGANEGQIAWFKRQFSQLPTFTWKGKTYYYMG